MDNFPKKIKSILVPLAGYYSFYTILITLVEPLGWFPPINNLFTNLGFWGNIILLGLPALIAIIVFFFHYRKKIIKNRFLGLDSVSTGSNRDEAFQSIRKKAKKKIVIVGIGMTNISRYARRTLEDQAKQVPIELLMIDPEFLKSNCSYAEKLEEFLDIPKFTESVQTSFDTLKNFCDSWNNNVDNSHKIGLKVYSTIPTMSMVMIDPDEDTGELVIEFFMYQSGEYRPRFHITKINSTDNLFARVKSEYLRLWSIARRIS